MPVPLRTNANFRSEAKYNVVTDFADYDLHSACASGNQGLVEFALARGQPINSVLDGVLPLHAACAGGHDQVVKVLIDHGADVNAPRLPRRYSNEKSRDSAPISGTTGSTPLHFAAANGNKSVMMTLLLRGAHPDRKDKYGVTPATLAEQNGWIECANILTNWTKNRDRDLRERETVIVPDDFGQAHFSANGRERGASFGNEEDTPGSTRKRVQVKRSIDTALNKFKTSASGSLTPQRPSLTISGSTLTPPTSPIRRMRDRSPSHSEDGHPPPSFDPGSRRPSLPQVLNNTPPSNHPLRNYKSATLVKAPKSPRRPRSAGNGADADADANGAGSAKSNRKLGTKYSLLNLFKKGQGNESSSSVPLERTSSHQTSSSLSIPIATSSSQHNIWSVLPLSSSPKHTAAFAESRSSSGPLPRPNFRFGSSSPSMSSSPLPQTSSPHNARTSSNSSAQVHPYSPTRSQMPLAVDLHNALAAQQHQTRDRSGSSSSGIGLGISFDGQDDNGALSRLAMHRIRPGHNRDRSGSGASNRNAMLIEDDTAISDNKGNPRPGILRGHHRTSSTGQASVLRALRFDSSSSIGSRRDNPGDEPPLRGCTSASSLNRVRRQMEQSPSRRQTSGSPALESSPLPHIVRIPDSAPAAISDFDTKGDRQDGDDDDDAYYGRPIEHRGVLDMNTHPDIRTRGRGLSFASSDSSMSPVLSAADPGLGGTCTAEFPFSINRPPPMLDDSDGSGSGSGSNQQLQPPAVDGRGRGDSVSSTSTTDSAGNPSLSASATTTGSTGSATITTPLRSPEAGAFINLPNDQSKMKNSDGLQSASEPAIEIVTEAPSPVMDPGDVKVVSLNERRSRSALGINMDLATSHAEAARLVQRTKEDILSAHNATDGLIDQMPLSARLAALGESLELERKLREKKQAEDLKRNNSETRSRAADFLREPSASTVSSEGLPGPGVTRQFSLNSRIPNPKKKEPKRPHTSSGTSSPTTPVPNVGFSKSDRTKPGHHQSHSASAVEMSPSLDSDLESSINYGYKLSTKRSITTDPDNDLSRISSLEGLDTDTELGPSLYRVSTAPNSSSPKSKRERDLASHTKLARMGFTPNDSTGRPSQTKRFNGLRSLMQTLKGR
ncbi:putative ankyrin-repeat protein [Paramarasmius palmivorus]|uniref:Ankyrin-repeat protein n=1 Tax=Paramarasmius palmivorus TaxID=297713 RepID=A0AAW0D2I1_9AGAR